MHARSYAQSQPQARQFWSRHPRMRTLPTKKVEFAGKQAHIISFQEVHGSAQLDVIVGHDDFQVLKVEESLSGGAVHHLVG